MLIVFSQNDPIAEDVFIEKWKTTVGDTFQDVVDLKLLSVRIAFLSLSLLKTFD